MGRPLDILAKSFVRTQQSTTQFASLLHCQWHNEPPPPNPPVPKIAIPGVRDDDEDTLATGDDSASSAHTRTQLDVLLNNGTYTANPATHCTHFPHSAPRTVAADEDGKLCIPNPHAGRLEHPEHRQGAGVQRKVQASSPASQGPMEQRPQRQSSPVLCRAQQRYTRNDGLCSPQRGKYAWSIPLESQISHRFAPSAQQLHLTTFPKQASSRATTSTTTCPFLVAALFAITSTPSTTTVPPTPSSLPSWRVGQTKGCAVSGEASHS